MSATLDAILLPHISDTTRVKYQTLAERAQAHDFGPLEQDVCVVDTETTGLSFKKCELIEISAARLQGKEVVDTFDTFVHPSGLIPPEIVKLTNIHQIDVADAPSAEDAVAALAEFVGGDLVLAHNATFDRTFVESVAGGTLVSDNWIDTLALSRIALPALTTHRLSTLAEVFGRASVTHRSSDDVAALCDMWPVILQGLADLPKGLLQYLCDMHSDIEWDYRPIFSFLAHEEGSAGFSLKETRADLLKQIPSQERKDADEIDEPYKVPSSAAIDEMFGPDGCISSMYDNYEERTEQVQMAQAVRDALATSSFRSIEAGTGVGKSLAYLVPEICFAQKNHVSVGVATKTNALTDQLVSHELPALNQVLPYGVSYQILKGWDHYPCLMRMERAYQEELPIDQVRDQARGYKSSKHTVAQDMLTALAVCYTYTSEVADGDLDALGIRWKNVPRSLVTTTSHECLRQHCPFFSRECVVYTARRLAASSDVVVTNHSLLLSNVLTEGHILPPIRHWVIDEAHNFEAEARSQWALEISSDDVRSTFEMLGDRKTGALSHALHEIAGTDGSELALRLITKASSNVESASLAMSEVMSAIHELIPLAKDSTYEGTTLWVNDKVRSSDEWKDLVEVATTAHRRLEEAGKRVQEAQTTLSLTSAKAGNELGEAALALNDLAHAISCIILEPNDSYVYSALLHRDTHRQNKWPKPEKLIAEKFDIGQDLSEKWLSEMKSVVFTSATIAVQKDFTHFDHAVGLDRLATQSHRDIQLASSFDFDNHMSVVVTKDLPVPGNPHYLEALEDLLFTIHTSMEGSVLTLFTNRREMDTIFENIRPRLAEEGLDLICQTAKSSPRQLRDRFIQEKSLSLFALKSFWEGFDAQGDTLRCVVVPKLPFASPRDPLVQEREAREPRSWWRYQLPEAVLSVKQAAGRLIRNKSDTGVLILCDTRLVQKRYGREFIESMPSHTTSQLEVANVGRYLQSWRASHE